MVSLNEQQMPYLKEVGFVSSDRQATTASLDADRRTMVRRGMLLNYATIGYNSLEAIASLIAGLLAGSIALVGFGIDSVIEVTASGAAQWRLRSDGDPVRRAHAERISLRVIGACFLGLAVYVSIDGGKALWLQERPHRTIVGVVILALSVLVMPVLAFAKREVADKLQSGALRAEAKQTSICAYLSVIALAGVALNTGFGWWWADPVAALAMVPIIVAEGIAGLRAKPGAADCC
jgi:divalent metal cation (Fe/Co/Zn/Cd) transporter